MFWGIVLLIATGLSWVAIGTVISTSARKGENLDRIQADSACCCFMVSVVLLFLTDQLPPLKVALSLILSGMANYFTFRLMNKAMQQGHHGIVWSLVQSALIWPFLMGVIFFDVTCTLFRGIGLVLIVSGILLTGILQGKGSQKNNSASRNCFFIVLAALVMAGASQCFANLPSYWINVDNCSIGKTAASQIGMLSAFCITVCHNKNWKGKISWKPVLILTGANLAAQYFLFYRGLDLVAQAGVGAIGYPVILGSCIAGFALYSALFLREKITILSAASTVCCLGGVILLSL